MNDFPGVAVRRKSPVVLPLICLWGLLIAWSLGRVPVPGVNEPYYLCKARHWWNPAWCSQDFFLNSANPHVVFYATWGWLTDVVPLPAAAVLGRILGLLVLACGWQCLAGVLTKRAWAGPLSMIAYLALQSLGNLSGEWLVGGIEGKVPAYGLLFGALGSFLIGRFKTAAVLAGLSVSLHPLVGLWGVLAAGAATVIEQFVETRRSSQRSAADVDVWTPPNARQLFHCGCLFTVAALPGLIPALSMLQESDPTAAAIATQLQVADRLSHHLDPMKFGKAAYRYWGLMIMLWLVIEQRLPHSSQQRWWRTLILISILIAAVGILIGFGPRPMSKMPGYLWRCRLLKFYFFRLGDLLVPVALSLSLIRSAFSSASPEQPQGRRAMQFATSLLLLLSLAAFVPFPDANPSRLTNSQLADWTAACRWLSSETDPSTLVYSTDSGWAVKWYAGRPEYVNYKDMPQDADSIVEWNRRLWVIARWRISAMANDEVSATELAELRRESGIRYLLCHQFGPIKQPPAYENATFRIYALPEATDRRESASR